MNNNPWNTYGFLRRVKGLSKLTNLTIIVPRTPGYACEVD